MLSDVKLGYFEVITPQQYNEYPWWQGTQARAREAPWSKLSLRIPTFHWTLGLYQLTHFQVETCKSFSQEI